MGRTALLAAEPEHEGASPPTRLGDFELQRELGRGAMGVVYQARQASLNRLVALKLILAGEFAGETERRRFLAEAEAAASLDHPNLVPIYEVGEHEGRLFQAMKLIEGRSLAERRAEFTAAGPEGSKRDAALVAKVARAVHHAHQRGFIHRDLKPGNILLDSLGEPHVSDFGLTRRVAMDSSLTLSGSPVGTPAYMAPELAAGTRSVTVAADLWSLGAMLYELLSGRPPFTAEHVPALLRRIIEEEPPPLPPAVPRDLATIVFKCLRKDPERRYAGAAELADDLERWLRGEPIIARAVGAAERVMLWLRRHPAVSVLTVLAVLLLLGGVSGITWQWRRANRHARETETALRQARGALWQANLDRARALRTSGQMGQRLQTLACLRAAAALRPAPELRDEAIAALALPDLEDSGPWLPIPDDVLEVAVDATLEHLFLALPAGRIELRSLTNGAVRAALTNFSGQPTGLYPSADGSRLAIETSRESLVWEPARDQILLRGAGGEFSGLSADGRRVVQVLRPQGLAIREVDTGREVARLGTDRLGAAQFSPAGDRVAFFAGNVIQAWKLNPPARLGELTLPQGSAGFAWKPDGSALAIGGEDRLVYVWHFEAGHVEKLAGHHREGVKTYYDPAGQLLASIAWDQELRLWDPEAGMNWLTTKAGRPLGFSADGQWLAVRGTRGIGRLRVHRSAECRLLHAPPGMNRSGTSFTFSPGDRLLAARIHQGFCVWEVASGRLLAFLPVQQPVSIAFLSPDVLLTGDAGEVALWTNSTPASGWQFGKLRTVFKAGAGGLYQTVPSSDQRQLFLRGETAGAVYDFAAGEIPKLAAKCELKGQPYLGPAPSVRMDAGLPPAAGITRGALARRCGCGARRTANRRGKFRWEIAARSLAATAAGSSPPAIKPTSSLQCGDCPTAGRWSGASRAKPPALAPAPPRFRPTARKWPSRRTRGSRGYWTPPRAASWRA